MRTLRRVIFISVGAAFASLGTASTLYWQEPIWGIPAVAVGILVTVLGIRDGAR